VKSTVDEVRCDQKVLVKSRQGAVRVDAADLGGRHDHHIRLGRKQKALGILLLEKIELFAADGNEITIYPSEPPSNGRPNQVTMACNEHSPATYVEAFQRSLALRFGT
jgi:hypothetical protein